MPNYSKILFALAQCVFVAATGVEPALAQSKTEWILQQHFDSRGDLAVYLSHDAIRIVNAGWGYQFVAKAPTWKVHCFRPAEKIDWSCDLKQFNGDMIENAEASGEPNKTGVVSVGHGVLHGLPCTIYAPSTRAHSRLFAADDIVISPQALDFICRFSGSPNPGKVPVYRGDYHILTEAQSSINEKDGWLSKLDYAADKRRGLIIVFTTNSWKKQPFNPLDFAYPQNYKVAGQLTMVTFSKEQKDTVTDLFGDAGTAFDSVTRKKPSASRP